MNKKFSIAIINATKCVGCARCIPVCPTSAIIGAAGFLHDVVDQECIGCQLCVPACPFEAIHMEDAPKNYQPTTIKDCIINKKERHQKQEIKSIDYASYVQSLKEEK